MKGEFDPRQQLYKAVSGFFGISCRAESLVFVVPGWRGEKFIHSPNDSSIPVGGMRHRKRIKRAENDKVTDEFHPSDGNRVIRPLCGTSSASSGCNQRDRLITELHSLC